MGEGPGGASEENSLIGPYLLPYRGGYLRFRIECQFGGFGLKFSAAFDKSRLRLIEQYPQVTHLLLRTDISLPRW
jgi:hypothetical protein